jgi:transcription antitermination factor NusG
MELCETKRQGRLRERVAVACLLLGTACSVNALAADSAHREPSQASQSAATPQLGTIKSITGKSIVLTTGAGAEVTIQLQDDTKLVRVEPGAKDLKNAAPIQLDELQPGDRILVRGKLEGDGKTLQAASVIAMKHADIAAKQAHERDEWQRHGVGGLVSAIDPATGTITISTNSFGTAKDVKVQVSKLAVLRRYATNSVKFDDAKPAPIDQIKVGDQLRARGTRSADGAELTADEVVSGTFRNIAGTINAVDANAGTITVMDLVAKTPITVKVGTETQIRKLPPMYAQRIAMRIKGTPTEGAPGGNGNGSPATRPAGEAGSPAGGMGGAGRPGASGGGDMQQMLSRLPGATLADLQKGDAVMIVTTEGTQENAATAITLLAGVEPILEASPKGEASSILTPWTMSAAPSGDTTP